MRRKDPVTPDVHDEVMRRDRECVLAKRNRAHVCHDQWGRWHASDDVAKLSLEHVKPELMAGRRGPSVARWMVSLCHAANVAVPSKDERAWMRSYLADLYPTEAVA